MDILQDRYFIIASKLSSFLGFWYTQTFRERVIRNCIIGFIFFDIVVAQICQLCIMDLNLQSMVLVLQIFIPTLCTTSIYFVYVLNFLTLKKILSWIIRDCHQLKDEVELKIMQKYVDECKLFALICGCLFYIFFCIIAFPYVLQIPQSHNEAIKNYNPDPILTCFNHFLEEKVYYRHVVIYEIIVAFIIVTTGIVAYSLYFWFIQHVCAHLCIIKFKISHPFQVERYNIRKKPQDFSDWSIDIIQHLARTKKFMGLVNKLGEKSYLFQVLMGCIIIVLDLLCMFEIPFLMQKKESRKNAFTFFVFIIDSILTIYLNCHIGQRLMDYSTDVYKEICLVPLHDIPLQTQKILLIMLTMNAKPYSISIGKMFVSSHEFFGNLFRMSFSVAMMLHSTQQV